jgi:Protein of unknown function, DUF288.
VVTSISAPNPVLKALAEGSDDGPKFIVVGDSKSPEQFDLPGCDFYSVERQRSLPFGYAKICHQRSYTRKNIGYLIALAGGAQFLVETDDDNYPRQDFWGERDPFVTGDIPSEKDWVNVYRYFSDSNIYPRGFPIELVGSQERTAHSRVGRQTLYCPIQQGLADGNPDVDAIYRMIFPLPLNFRRDNPLILERGQWSPFNSQNTTTFAPAYPLLYLPTFCSFRMTDIWRSFVAQRVAWACDWNVSFHYPTVYQERNEHNLLGDFADEVSGYLNNAKIAAALDALDLAQGADHLEENMKLCYLELIRMGLVHSDEITLLDAWFADIHAIQEKA